MKIRRAFLAGASCFLLALLAGCEGGEGSGYYLQAKFNGQEKDFSHDANFQGGGNDGRWEMIVVGGSESSIRSGATRSKGLPPGYDFELWVPEGNIGPGTYSTATNDLISRYSIQNGRVVCSALPLAEPGAGAFTLKIDELGKQGIKGTFQGVLIGDCQPITVTDGAFYLPYSDG